MDRHLLTGGAARFIGQIEPKGYSKVPSVVCYDQNGNVVAAGAETDPEVNQALFEMDGVIRAEWYDFLRRFVPTT